MLIDDRQNPRQNLWRQLEHQVCQQDGLILKQIGQQSDRFATALMGSFAALALFLALLGTYGVLAGSVNSRTREFGIRMALGAEASDVRKLVLRYGATIVLPGIVLGIVGAMVGARSLEALLFGVEAGDPTTYVAVVLGFATFALLSAWLPARRATRVDTVETLTAE